MTCWSRLVSHATWSMPSMSRPFQEANLIGMTLNGESTLHMLGLLQGSFRPDAKFAPCGCWRAMHALVACLVECGIDTVAMESTGVFWIPICAPKSASVERF